MHKNILRSWRWRRLWIIALVFLFSVQVNIPQDAQAAGPFTDIAAGLTGLVDGAVVWGDYDNDGDLDLLIMGSLGASYATQIWRNDGGGTFVDIVAGLPGITLGDAAWGDYDNDGDLDLVIAGWTGATRVTQIWRNDGGGSFVNIAAPITGVNSGSVAWGDYDNDGDLDLLISGWTGSQRVTQIWRNDGAGVFVNINAGLTGVENGQAIWGDYNKDGYLDVLLAGWNGAQRVTQLWRNNRAADGTISFVNSGFVLPGVDSASIAFGDYDNDGDLDILIAGKTNASQITEIWRYHNNTYVKADTLITGVRDGTSVAWGDYDNDGDLDLAVSGRDLNGFEITQIWRNDNGVFSNFVTNITGVVGGSLAWGDHNNDGRLDLVVSGFNGINRVTQIWQNDMLIGANLPPQPPQNLNADVVGQGAILTWNPATDDRTPQNGLNYNVRIGTFPGGNDITSGMANIGTGYRHIPAIGNTQTRLNYHITGLLPNTVYYWSVQAIDTAFAASGFPVEGNFTTPPYQIMPIDLTGVASGSVVAWGDYDKDGDLDLLVSGYDGVNRVTQIWRNNGGNNFVQLATTITGVIGGDATWGDYDNDGDLDLLISGLAQNGQRVTELWRNNNGVFTKVNIPFTAVSGGSVVWGDYNNDGRLDVLLAGDTGTTRVTQIWRNNGNDSFTKVIDLEGVIDSSFAWGDYNNNGYMDLLMSGRTVANGRVTRVYRNNGDNTFTNINAGLLPVAGGEVAWGDYNNDGYLDVALTGDTAAGRATRIYRNDNGLFTDINAGITPLQFSSLAWGDYDNDGDLDLIIAGQVGPNTEDARVTQIWRNDGLAGFNYIGAGLVGISQGDIAFGDYDNDGDLDVALAGWTGSQRVTQIWRNDGGFAANVAPAAPTIVTAQVGADSAILIFNPSVDDTTPAAGLSYNVRIGNLPGFTNIVSPMSNASGYRQVAQLGNAHDNIGELRFIVTGLEPNRTYYWSVQAIDHAFAGSPFSAEGVLVTSNGNDALVLFNSATGQGSFLNTLNDNPPPASYNTFVPGAPINGQWVLGDWNADGRETPGVYSGGAFYFTNDFGPTVNWEALWLGPAGPVAVIAGGFDDAFANDCLGVVEQATLLFNGVNYTVFVLYYTCVMTTNVPPISFQWLSAVLPDQAGFAGTHQFAAGDFNNNGVDSVAVRRGQYVAFTNIAPATGHAEFNLAQFWGTPPGSVGEGRFVVGNWDNVGGDSFGVFYSDNNEFFYRNDVEWNTGIFINQTIVNPVGLPLNVLSWTPTGISAPIVAELDGFSLLGDDVGEDETPIINDFTPLDLDDEPSLELLPLPSEGDGLELQPLD